MTTLRVSAGMAANATLDALISNVGSGDLTLKLDVGNDGTWDWQTTQAVTDAATLTSPGLAAAFNAYWSSHGAPTSGMLDVPVTVSLSKAGQILLTNLQMRAAASKSRAIRLPAQNYTTFNLDFTVGGSGAGPNGVAVDIGDNGSIDWTSSDSPGLPIRLVTGNLAAALNSYLAGKSGDVDVPIRIYVAPDSAVTLNDYHAVAAPTIDLAAKDIQVSGSGTKEGDSVPVKADLANNSGLDSGPVTAAFFATAPGWGDWYIGSAFVPNISGKDSEPVSINWNTAGFAGNVPIKVIANPYKRTPETNYDNNQAVGSAAIGTALAAPSLSSPGDGTTTADNTPTFTWSAVAGATQYRIQIDNSADFSNPEVDATTANTSYTTNALVDGVYHWRAQAQDAVGNWSDWSAARSLTISAKLAPPALNSPSDGTTTADHTPTFTWNAVAGATQYRLQVDDNAGFGNPEVDATTANTSYTAGALADGVYHWQVQAQDAVGNWSDWSEARSLTVKPSGINLPTVTEVRLQPGACGPTE